VSAVNCGGVQGEGQSCHPGIVRVLPDPWRAEGHRSPPCAILGSSTPAGRGGRWRKRRHAPSDSTSAKQDTWKQRKRGDRARFADTLRFDGIWGSIMSAQYGEGPARVIRGRDHAGRRGGGLTTKRRLGVVLVGRYDLPASSVLRQKGQDNRPRVSNGRPELSYGACGSKGRRERRVGIRYRSENGGVDAFQRRDGRADRRRPAHDDDSSRGRALPDPLSPK